MILHQESKAISNSGALCFQKRNNCKITFLIGFGLDKVMCQYWLPSRYEYRFRFNLLLKATFYIRWGFITPILVFNKYTKYLIKLRNEFLTIENYEQPLYQLLTTIVKNIWISYLTENHYYVKTKPKIMNCKVLFKEKSHTFLYLCTTFFL